MQLFLNHLTTYQFCELPWWTIQRVQRSVPVTCQNSLAWLLFPKSWSCAQTARLSGSGWSISAGMSSAKRWRCSRESWRCPENRWRTRTRRWRSTCVGRRGSGSATRSLRAVVWPVLCQGWRRSGLSVGARRWIHQLKREFKDFNIKLMESVSSYSNFYANLKEVSVVFILIKTCTTII